MLILCPPKKINLLLNAVKMIAIAGTFSIFILSVHAQTHDGPASKNINSNSIESKLVCFGAKVSGKKIMVNWAVSSEKNTSHYIIQRSADGKSFDDSEIVFTGENSEGQKQYSFPNDTNFSHNGKVYYRLKIVDSNSKSKYSNIVVVHLVQSQMALLASW